MPRTIEDDMELIANILLGDRGAQRHFVQIHESFIRSVIYRLGRDTNLYVDDLYQGIYEYLARDNYHVLGTWQHTAQLKTYLHTIVRRYAVKLLKELKSMGPGYDEGKIDIKPESPSPEETRFTNELKECLDRVMASLSVSYRNIITLKHKIFLTHKEIGSRLGITVTNSCVRLSRAETKLRTLFENICPDHTLELFKHPSL